jgi:hypothetical protein
MATLENVYRSLFVDHPDDEDPFERTPLLPADIFAFAAHLLERSGAYHHISPDVDMKPSKYRALLVDSSLRNRAISLGRQWLDAPISARRQLPSPPAGVTRLWRRLKEFRDEQVFEALEEDADAPNWWIICLELMIVADEASLDIGFDISHPFSIPVQSGYAVSDTISGFRRVQRAPFSLSTAAEDLLCVQPKSRTPSVGCTLRSLSHHLALLPPRGQVRARWVQSLFPREKSKDDERLGLLLLPFPYRIDDKAFRPKATHHKDAWGWFGVRATWLPMNQDRARREAFLDFIQHLIDEARSEGQQVNGVILPELALNFVQFMSLARMLAKDRSIEFLIAGTTHDQNGRSGNFVAIAPFFLLGRERNARITAWEKIILVREKHHRWKLNNSQIDAYDLDLDRRKSWWEHLTILSRSLDVLVFRGDSTLTTLICEDLARVDPCQAVVRGIGPNLLIALLMDGPQLSNRWPARYATAFADDPGTSVLSLTSFGLIARQNDLGKFPQASAVALWKDEVGGVKILELPREADALVLQLKAVEKTERTLDGRSDDGSSHRWEYKSHRAISARASNRPGWITSGVGRT